MTGRRFAGDVAALAAVRVVSMAAGFAVSIIGARVLGAAALGAVGAAQTIGLAAAVVANGGLNIATIYYLGARPAERPRVMDTLLPVAAVAAAASTLLALLAGWALAQPLGLADESVLLAVGALLAGAVIAYEFWTSVLLGIARSRAYTLTELVRALGTLAATAMLLAGLWRDEVGYLFAATAAYLLAAVFARSLARRDLAGARMPGDGALRREALAMGLRGQVGNVLQFLNLRLDLLLVPALLDLRAAGIYVVAVRVSEVVAQAASASGSLIFPRVAAGGGDAVATDLTERTVRQSVTLVTVAGLLLALVADPLLRLAFGAEFAAGADTVCVLLLAMLPLTLTRVLAGDLKGRGRAGTVSLAMGVAVATTIGLDLLLIPALGIVGAALASLVAYSLAGTGLVVAFARIARAHPARLIPGPGDVRDIASWLRGRG